VAWKKGETYLQWQLHFIIFSALRVVCTLYSESYDHSSIHEVQCLKLVKYLPMFFLESRQYHSHSQYHHEFWEKNEVLNLVIRADAWWWSFHFEIEIDVQTEQNKQTSVFLWCINKYHKFHLVFKNSLNRSKQRLQHISNFNNSILLCLAGTTPSIQYTNQWMSHAFRTFDRGHITYTWKTIQQQDLFTLPPLQKTHSTFWKYL
jgi:hypothetical protein